jgi:hypothetical protein
MGTDSICPCFRDKCNFQLVALKLVSAYENPLLIAETQPNHVRSLTMASAFKCQWVFNCVITRITAVMLNSITYGTFLIFGVCCIVMVIYTVFW